MLALIGALSPPAIAQTTESPLPHARAGELLGLRLGMPLDAALRRVQSLAPPGSVTLPMQRREAFSVVTVEAPADILPAPVKPAGDPRQENFYLALNAAPRVFKNQTSRSSHVAFVTLVAEESSRQVVRIVIEPAYARWSKGLDAATLDADTLAQRVSGHTGIPARVVNAAPAAFRERPWAARPSPPEPTQAAEVRINAQRGSVVLTDPRRLPDAQATRWALD